MSAIIDFLINFLIFAKLKRLGLNLNNSIEKDVKETLNLFKNLN